MNSSYIHLIALVVAVFFSGVFLRGERARKKEIKDGIIMLRARQQEILATVDTITAVSAQKDSLFKLRIAYVKDDIEALDKDAELAKRKIDSLDVVISGLQARVVRNIQAIRDAGGFVYLTYDKHSVQLDPDIEPQDSVAFNPIAVVTGDSLIFTPDLSHATPHLDFAKRYVGVVEKPRNSNRGDSVEVFLESVGLKPTRDRDGTWRSFPYCAAFVSFCLENAPNVKAPMVRSARARAFITQKSIPARIVQRGTVKVKPGTLVIWKAKRNPNDTSGHIGIVDSWEGQFGTTVEANTGPGDEGSQRDGDGVYMRKRVLQPGNAFRITHFTPVEFD